MAQSDLKGAVPHQLVHDPPSLGMPTPSVWLRATVQIRIARIKKQRARRVRRP
jgi:hypothetical protein